MKRTYRVSFTFGAAIPFRQKAPKKRKPWLRTWKPRSFWTSPLMGSRYRP